jgi:hypothetical protein
MTVVTGGASPYRYLLEQGTFKTDVKLTSDGSSEETLAGAPEQAGESN